MSGLRSRAAIIVAAVIAGAAIAFILLDAASGPTSSGPSAAASAALQPSRAAPATPTRADSPAPPSSRSLRNQTVLGQSVQGRPIVAVELGDPNATRRLLVVGCIHGNEPAGIAIADRLASVTPPSGVDLWVILDLNPDGVAAHTRQNANRVDLNRNFPYGWRASGAPGDQQYPGPSPLSEPESQIAAQLIQRLQPQITIWFHQPLATVDQSGGNVKIERRFARLAKLPLRRLTRYPGSAAGWQNHAIAASTAFIVELPGGRLSSKTTARLARAVLRLG